MDYLQMLDKKDIALLYRELRDTIIAKQKKVEDVPDEYYQVLGKLKIILNVRSYDGSRYV